MLLLPPLCCGQRRCIPPLPPPQTINAPLNWKTRFVKMFSTQKTVSKRVDSSTPQSGNRRAGPSKRMFSHSPPAAKNCNILRRTPNLQPQPTIDSTSYHPPPRLQRVWRRRAMARSPPPAPCVLYAVSRHFASSCRLQSSSSPLFYSYFPVLFRTCL